MVGPRNHSHHAHTARAVLTDHALGPRARGASWYRKPLPTFSDALAVVRRELWAGRNLQKSSQILSNTR
jgi:hypothetical protein